MRTIANNVRVPEDDDAGNVWADAIEHDLELLSQSISDLGNITVTNINRDTTPLDKANWGVDPNGKGYKQIVSMPNGVTFLNSKPTVTIASGPKIYTPIHPTITPISLTAFEIYVHDSTLDLTVLYV